jgi:hypothetical protein
VALVLAGILDARVRRLAPAVVTGVTTADSAIRSTTYEVASVAHLSAVESMLTSFRSECGGMKWRCSAGARPAVDDAPVDGFTGGG